MAKAISVNPNIPGGLKKALEASGWLPAPVEAAGQLRQGKEPSMASMITGTALLGLLKRPAKGLPRHFVVAVTASEVVVFKALGVGEEDGSNYKVRISPGDKGSFPRSEVSLTDVVDDGKAFAATMHLPGMDPFPVHLPDQEGEPNTSELAGVLAPGSD